MTFCDPNAETRVSFRTNRKTDGTDGRTDRCGSRNSHLDMYIDSISSVPSISSQHKRCGFFYFSNIARVPANYFIRIGLLLDENFADCPNGDLN